MHEEQQARKRLGVSDDASASEIRRAYLRLIKSVPPEVDPKGFQEIRRAYELLSGQGGHLVVEGSAAGSGPVEGPRFSTELTSPDASSNGSVEDASAVLDEIQRLIDQGELADAVDVATSGRSGELIDASPAAEDLIFRLAAATIWVSPVEFVRLRATYASLIDRMEISWMGAALVHMLENQQDWLKASNDKRMPPEFASVLCCAYSVSDQEYERRLFAAAELASATPYRTFRRVAAVADNKPQLVAFWRAGLYSRRGATLDQRGAAGGDGAHLWRREIARARRVTRVKNRQEYVFMIGSIAAVLIGLPILVIWVLFDDPGLLVRLLFSPAPFVTVMVLVAIRRIGLVRWSTRSSLVDLIANSAPSSVLTDFMDDAPEGVELVHENLLRKPVFALVSEIVAAASEDADSHSL